VRTTDRSWVRADTHVGLAFYGAIVYVAVVAALEAQHEPPDSMSAIGAVVATASVLFVAHVFAALVPKTARAGRLHPADLAQSLRHDSPLIITVVVPVIPFVLSLSNVVELETAYRLSVRCTLAMLFGLTVALSRSEGLGWVRAALSGAVILCVTITITWLETHVH
jgi:hypothetical protein